VTAFLDRLSNSVSSGDISTERRLTSADLKKYAERVYRGARPADLEASASD
jgi:hypothetical protein